MKKTVLKVSINCQKCKTEVMKAVTKLEGINSVAVDGEKGILTVVGDVDPVLVTIRVRKKTGKVAEIVSVGPPKPPTPEPSWQPLPHCCNDCQLVAVGLGPYNDARFCPIL